MKNEINKRINQLQYYAHNWLIVIQNITLKILLFFTYFIFVGFAYLLMPILGKKLLKKINIEKEQNTYWVESEGYDYSDSSKIENQV